MEFEHKLIPILREGVDVIKAIFFKKLRIHLSAKHPGQEPSHISMLAGAVLNDLFGAPAAEERFAVFAVENRSLIEEELGSLAVEFAEMRIALTDALRVQFLCDHQEGVDSTHVLSHARDLGVLLVDREAPLPASFMNLVRKLGAAFHVLAPGQ
jgi:hypothetical protein